MMRKAADLLFAALFLVILLGVMLGTMLWPKQTVAYYENRTLAQRPQLSAAAVVDGSYFSDWDDYLIDHALLRGSISRLNTFADIYLFRRPVVNDVVVTPEMLLGYYPYEQINVDDIRRAADRMADQLEALNELITSYGGRYYYMAIPGQTAYFQDRYPAYLNNRSAYTEMELALFRQALQAREILLIDMGPVYDELGHPDDFFSAVDYHFTYYGGLIAAQTLLQVIADTSDAVIPLFSEEDYTFTQLPNPYMGSRGRKLLDVWRAEEKAEFAVLNTPVPFLREDNGETVEPETVRMPPNDQVPVFYNIYMGGDQAHTVIRTGREELPTILIYGDSFTNVIESVAYTSFDTLYSIDLRHYHEMSLAEYIALVQPDIVVCVRDYEVLLSMAGNGALF